MRSIVPSCCDDRMGLARRGALSSAELLDFATHLATCADCRIAWRVSADFEGSSGAVPGDERLIARAANAALAATPRARIGFTRVAAAAAALLVTASVASATIALRARRSALVSSATESASGPRRARTGMAISARPPSSWSDVVIPPAMDVSPPLLPTTEAESKQPHIGTVSHDRVERPSARPNGRSALRLRAASPTALEPAPVPSVQRPSSAREMFERAVSARQQGRVQEAIDSFRALQSHFPGTPESLVSLISLGELQLATGAAADAAASFADYQDNAPAGALAPEALAGQARALARLGRARESEAKWRELARRFPGSPEAHRAAELERERPAP
jgi:TolA-binding protein